jgi:Xaa-Pro dipeptidase
LKLIICPSFYYLAGINIPDCALTYDLALDQLVIWIPQQPDPRMVLYYGTIPTPASTLELTDVDQIHYISTLPAFLQSHALQRTKLFALHKSQLPPPLTRPALYVALSGGAGQDIDVTSLQPAMDAARVIKTPYEIDAIRRANFVSSQAHGAVLRRLREDGLPNEQDAEASFRAACIERGAHKQAYPPIAGAGTHAATLHYTANDAETRGCETLVLDAGAEWDCYASDVTRTLPLTIVDDPDSGGRRYGFSERAGKVYALVAQMQTTAIEMVRPGAKYLDLQRAATRVAVDGLLALGLLRGAAADVLLTLGTVAAFFPHGLGHHVGLEVHDVLSPELLGRSAAAHSAGEHRPGGGCRKWTLLSAEDSAAVAAPGAFVWPGSRWSGEKGRMVRKDELMAGMIITIEPGM